MKKMLMCVCVVTMLMSTLVFATGNKDSNAKKVVYWSMWQETEPQADALKTAIQAFEKANPTVKVEVEWAGRGVKDLVTPAIASGQQVDLFDSDPLQFYKSDPGIMDELSDFYASQSKTAGKTVEQTLLPGLTAWDKSMSARWATPGLHSVPYSPYVISWFYNRDHFEKAGIKKLPTTLQEFDEVCAALKKAGFAPIITDDAYIGLMNNYMIERIIGEDKINEIILAGGDAYKNDGIKQVLSIIEDFAKKGYFSNTIKTNKYPAGQMAFARGEASMYLNASWFPSEIREVAGPNFKYGQFAPVTIPGGIGKITENTVGGQAFVVSSKSTNKTEAYELLRYFISKDCQQEFLNRSLVPAEVTLDWPKDVAEQKVIVATLSRNINWAASFGGKFIESVYNPEMTKVLFGEKTAAAAYAEIIAQAAKFK